MDGKPQSKRAEQDILERFSPEVAENNSKDYMSGSPTMENRQISGVGVTFGPGMEVHKVMPEMTCLPYYRAESKRVNVYWGRQFSKYTIKMNQDPSSLLTIHSLFLSGEIRVRGKPVTTKYFSSGPGSGTLELLELPPSVTGGEIKSQIPPELLRGAQWSTKQPKFKDSSALSTVRSLLSQFGPLKDQGFETLPTMMRVSAWFQNENDARRAVEVLNQSPLPLDPQQVLMARLEYRMEFNGPERWGQNFLLQLLSKASISRNIHNIKLVPSRDDEPRFSLSGENREVLVEAMEWVRKLPVCDQIHEDKLSSRGFITTDDCCVICGDTAESPVITQCKHVYCGNCFHNLCSSTFSLGSWRDQVVCQAPKPSGTSTALDNSICGRTLTLPEIQEMVKANTFEHLLTASFKSYVNRHPNKLHSCPTTNCDYIYVVPEPNDNPDTAPHITCPHCLAEICTRCHEGHTARGMTCLEFQDHLAHGANSIALAKAEQDIQDCPSCTTPLVKVEGCNHVTCPVCDTHLCWKCLKMFRGEGAAERVYSHLVAMHDGILDDDFLDDEYDEYDEYDGYEEDEEDLGDDDDDDDDNWEQDYRFGGPEAAPVLVFYLERMHRQVIQLLGRMQRRAEGNVAVPHQIEDGQGEQADSHGQDDNGDDGDDGEGTNVNGDNAANQEGIGAEDEQVVLQVQGHGAPEARRYQEERLERVVFQHELRLLEREVWLEDGQMDEQRVQPHHQHQQQRRRMDWEEIDVIVHGIVYDVDFFAWLVFFIVAPLWKSTTRLFLYGFKVCISVTLAIFSLPAMAARLVVPFLFRVVPAVFVVFLLVAYRTIPIGISRVQFEDP